MYSVQQTGMPRTPKNDDLEQVLTRISGDAHRTLEIACAAERKSMTELLRPVVEAHAEHLAKEPEIAVMLEQARNYEARKKGVELLRKKSDAKPSVGSGQG
jgi:hypothetical protein